MRVIVTGATGFVGSHLVSNLRARRDDVIAFSRDAETAKQKLVDGVTCVTADLENPGPWADALAGADAIVHLAGQSIGAKRWDAREKQVIRDSRVEATRVLVEQLAKVPADRRPKVLVTASGADYYPFALDKDDFDDDEVTESDPAGDSFLARVCRDWEKEAQAAEALGVRVCRMRSGIVLGEGAEALDRMKTPFKLFAGGRIGSGRQWFPWIHVADAAEAYATAVHDDRYKGPINLVRDSVRNAELAKALGAAMKRPSWLPVPAFAVKLAAGEMAEYVLQGRRVVPKRLRELGFTWKHTDLVETLTSKT